MMKFYWELDRAARRILEAVGLALGLTEAEKEYLVDVHSGHNNQLRLLHYPPIPTEKLRKNIVARMPAHRDWRYVLGFQSHCLPAGLSFPVLSSSPFHFLSAFATLMRKTVHSQCSSKTTVAVWNLRIQTTQALSCPLRPFLAL